MKVYLHALNSCGMRHTVVQQYRDFILAHGHQLAEHPSQADLTLVWTCAFRADFRDNSLDEIQRLQDDFTSEVIVGGCLPDIDPELLASRFQGRVVSWRDDWEKLGELLGVKDRSPRDIPYCLTKPQLYEDEQKYRRENPGADVPYVGRFIQLFCTEGCLFQCTYCSEQLAFPPFRSFPERQIVTACLDEVKRNGKKRVVLLGDSIGEYGSDINSSLPRLIESLLQAEPELRLGIQGLNPIHFVKYYEQMIRFIRRGVICHLQIPMQTASDKVLQLMQRPYTRADLSKVFQALNDTGFTEFDTHLIMGFPGETDEDAGGSVDFILKHNPHYVLLSGFMETSSMAAARLPNKVDPRIKRRRLREAEARIKAAGIICNCDDSELSKERFANMSRID